MTSGTHMSTLSVRKMTVHYCTWLILNVPLDWDFMTSGKFMWTLCVRLKKFHHFTQLDVICVFRLGFYGLR